MVIDAGRHDLDAFGVGVVQASTSCARSSSVEASMRSAHTITSCSTARPVLGVVVETDFGFDARERVKGRDERHVERVLQPVRDRARQPVVPVQHVDRIGLEHAFHGRVDERLDELVQRVLGHGRERTSWYVHDAEAASTGTTRGCERCSARV